MPQRFAVDQRAVISINTDTVTQLDSASSHMELTFSELPVTDGVNGTVDTVLVGGAGRAPATPAGLSTPFPFHAAFAVPQAQLEFTAPLDSTPCSSVALAAAQSLRDLWFLPPDTLRDGSTWSDSSSFVSCRDGIPLRATIHRMFHVSGAAVRDGHTVLAISRLSRTLLSGQGLQFGDSVAVAGSGNGQLTYQFDPVSGEVMSATGNATLDFSLRSSRRTQIVRQSAEIRIGRR
ncbi:MAG: hypothetical protein ACREN6_16975 [Gemmatimonadaceae bacterium]